MTSAHTWLQSRRRTVVRTFENGSNSAMGWHMVGGGIAARWSTKEEALAGVYGAKTISRVDEYHSESLIITRVVTREAGTYFLVTESDCVFAEDVDALEALGVEVGEPWRMRVLEVSYWGRPHPALPMSSTFRVHIVHPEGPDDTP